MSYLLLQGNARRLPIADNSVHVCVTSPPYFNLRDYQTATWEGGDPGCDHQPPNDASNGNKGQPTIHPGRHRGDCRKCGARRIDLQIGLEKTPSEYVAAMVEVFREVRRVLHPSGTAWLNLGDSYASSPGRNNTNLVEWSAKNARGGGHRAGDMDTPTRRVPPGLKPKDLIGIPHMVAMALRDDGWYWRDAVVWSKAEVEDDELEGSCMPGSQRDRCTFAYEMVFQFAKSPDYFFDLEAGKTSSGATPRNVWRINTEPSKFPHFATMPTRLAANCVKMGTSEKGACPACLSPWVREVLRERKPTRPGMVSKVYAESPLDLRSPYQSHNGDICGNRDPARHVTVRTTKGWKPSCECDAGDPVPCTVFDPFNGVGSTGVAALALGRRYIGLDLSADYLRQAKQRLERPHQPIRRNKAKDMPLFREVES